MYIICGIICLMFFNKLFCRYRRSWLSFSGINIEFGDKLVDIEALVEP